MSVLCEIAVISDKRFVNLDNKNHEVYRNTAESERSIDNFEFRLCLTSILMLASFIRYQMI